MLHPPPYGRCHLSDTPSRVDSFAPQLFFTVMCRLPVHTALNSLYPHGSSDKYECPATTRSSIMFVLAEPDVPHLDRSVKIEFCWLVPLPDMRGLVFDQGLNSP